MPRELLADLCVDGTCTRPGHVEHGETDRLEGERQSVGLPTTWEGNT